MSNFASIKFIEEYAKVAYYSVVIDGAEDGVSIFENFVAKHTKENKEKLNHILAWIKKIGDMHGAKEYFFRHEMAAEALPPPLGKGRQPTYIEDGQNAVNNLRLYCHRLNDRVVVLFDGDIKTADTPQECPQVKSHFNLANILSKLIDKSFADGTIEWDEDGWDILYDEDFKIDF